MFSLLITVLSIVLVATLAMSTLYYMGAIYTDGAAKAQAMTVRLQGQQIFGAMELYYSAHGTWPQDIAELVAGEYLRGEPPIPEAISRAPSMLELVLPSAMASGTARWEIPIPGRPHAWVADGVNAVSCQALNGAALQNTTVYKYLDPGYKDQCAGLGPFTYFTTLERDTVRSDFDGRMLADGTPLVLPLETENTIVIDGKGIRLVNAPPPPPPEEINNDIPPPQAGDPGYSFSIAYVDDVTGISQDALAGLNVLNTVGGERNVDFVVTNTGEHPLTFRGSNAIGTYYALNWDGCAQQTVQPGESCYLYGLLYTPQALGEYQAAAVTLSTTRPNAPVVQFELGATAVMPQIAASPFALDLGSVIFGEAHTGDLQLSNLSPGRVPVSLSTQGTDAVLLRADDCVALPCMATITTVPVNVVKALSANTGVLVTVGVPGFTVAQLVPVSAEWRDPWDIVDDGPAARAGQSGFAFSVTYTDTVTGAAHNALAGLNVSNTVGSDRVVDFVVRNTGSVAMTMSAATMAGPHYVLGWDGCTGMTLQPNVSCFLYGTLRAPLQLGYYAGAMITIGGTNPSAPIQKVKLAGNAVMPQISTTTEWLNLGTAPVGAYHTGTFVIRNLSPGRAPVTITAQGSDAAKFNNTGCWTQPCTTTVTTVPQASTLTTEGDTMLLVRMGPPGFVVEKMIPVSASWFSITANPNVVATASALAGSNSAFSGTWTAGVSSRRGLFIRNTGSANLSLSYSITGPGAEHFQLTDMLQSDNSSSMYNTPCYGNETEGGCTVATLSPARPHVYMVVNFNAKAAGTHTATLTINTNSASAPQIVIPLSGTSAFNVTAALSTNVATTVAPSGAFGSFGVNVAIPRAIFIRNAGTAGALAADLTISGSDAFTIADYRWVDTSSNTTAACSIDYSGRAADCTARDALHPSPAPKHLWVNLMFAPGAAVGTHTGTLTVAHNGTNASPLTLALSATVQFDVTATASAAQGSNTTFSPNFGAGLVGMAVTRDLFIRNTGSYGMLATSFSLSGSPAFTATLYRQVNDASDWWMDCGLSSSGFSSTAPCVGHDRSDSSLLAGKYPNTQIRLRFLPDATGTHNATLTVTHTGTNASPIVLNLTGTATANPVAATASNQSGANGAFSGDFGARAVASLTTRDLFIRNTGSGGALSISRLEIPLGLWTQFRVIEMRTVNDAGVANATACGIGDGMLVTTTCTASALGGTYPHIRIRIQAQPAYSWWTDYDQLLITHNGSATVMPISLQVQGL